MCVYNVHMLYLSVGNNKMGKRGGNIDKTIKITIAIPFGRYFRTFSTTKLSVHVATITRISYLPRVIESVFDVIEIKIAIELREEGRKGLEK